LDEYGGITRFLVASRWVFWLRATVWPCVELALGGCVIRGERGI
jgi:hypothetical protein